MQLGAALMLLEQPNAAEHELLRAYELADNRPATRSCCWETFITRSKDLVMRSGLLNSI